MSEAPHPNALPGRSMKKCPGGNATGDPMPFAPAVTLALAIGEKPPGRDELDLPDDDDIKSLLDHVEKEVNTSAWKRQVGADLLGRVTSEEAKAIAAYTLEHPYPLYKWINAWLMSNRRDDKVQKHIGPFFVLLYRALEKLPRHKVRAARGVQVREIPALMDTFQNYKERCAKGSELNFWGFASFSTRDDVSTDPQFVGDEKAQGIVYACGELECVNIAPFSLMGTHEAEVLPLPPLLLKVQSAVKFGQKLIVSVEQVFHDSTCYVVPRVARSGTTAPAPPAVAASAPAASSAEPATSNSNKKCDEKVVKVNTPSDGAAAAAAAASSSASKVDSSTKKSLNWEHAATLCQLKDDDQNALRRCTAWIVSKPDSELQAPDKLTIAFCVVARTCSLYRSNPTEAPIEKALSLWQRLEAAWNADRLPQGTSAEIAARGAASLAEFLWRDAKYQAAVKCPAFKCPAAVKCQAAADVCASALRFTEDEDLRASLLNTRGNSLEQMGRREEGLALQKEALEMRRRIHRGVDHPDLAASLNNVGISLEQMGKREEGVALQQEALEMYRRLGAGYEGNVASIETWFEQNSQVCIIA